MTNEPNLSLDAGLSLPAPRSGLGRVGTAMITPFDADGQLDLDGAQRIAQYLVDAGTEMVVVNGTTGESPTVSGEEPWQVLRAVREAVGARATVIAGTGSNDTARTIAATRRAEEEGADGVLVVAPYYNRPDHRGLLAHFTAAAAATDLPVVIYDVPHRSGQQVELHTLIELAGIDNIVGLKDATCNLGKVADLVRAIPDAPGGFDIWSGADEVNLPMLALGAVGVISVSSHLAGPEIAEMIATYDRDPARARALHLACMPVHRALFAEPSPAPLKAALQARGLPSGPVRPPLAPASAEACAAVLAALEPVEAARVARTNRPQMLESRA